MTRLAKAGLLCAAVLLTACYHATIDTGLAPSNQVIEKAWASGWVFGLVPPSTVETQSKCSSGVSKVETQLSFVNQLVAFLTLDIYTPMNIKVTCAQGGRASIPSNAAEIYTDRSAGPVGAQRAFDAAALEAMQNSVPVFVEFR
jgi:Bor protein